MFHRQISVCVFVSLALLTIWVMFQVQNTILTVPQTTVPCTERGESSRQIQEELSRQIQEMNERTKRMESEQKNHTEMLSAIQELSSEHLPFRIPVGPVQIPADPSVLRKLPAPLLDSSLEHDAAAVEPNTKPLTFFDQIACRSASAKFANETNVREGGVSDQSGTSNRQRQIALGLLNAVASLKREKLIDSQFRSQASECISDLSGLKLDIFNTDANAALHHVLNNLVLSRYVASEYFPNKSQSGEYEGLVRHEDLQALSFANNSFHLVLSTEVFEHIPDPYKAHAEIFRVLRPGGSHVFTVPFAETADNDIVMARLDANGNIKYTPGQPPQYHGDPIRKEGILVFTVFSPEMLVKLAHIGYKVDVKRVWDPGLGILGQLNLVFTAYKPL